MRLMLLKELDYLVSYLIVHRNFMAHLVLKSMGPTECLMSDTTKCLLCGYTISLNDSNWLDVKIPKVIIDMETFKQEFQNHLQEAHDRLMLSRKLREDLLVAKQKMAEHKAIQRQKKSRRICESAAIARSILRNKLQQFREYAKTKKSEDGGAPDNSADLIEDLKQSPDYSENFNLKQSLSTAVGLGRNQSLKTSKSAHDKKARIPEIGEMVFVPSLSKHAMVLKVEESKGDVIVKASNIKLRLKLSDIVKD